MVTYASFFNLTPLYPRVGADLGLDAGALGALVGLGGIVALLVQLPAGSGADALGRRPFFAAGMLLLLLSLALRWQTEHPLQFLAAQIAAGAALGIVGTNAFAMMAGTRNQGQAFGIVNASINVGQVIGYLAAGILGPALGWRVLSAMLASLPLAVLLLVVRASVFAGPPDRTTTRASPLSIVHALAHPRRLALSALAALTLAVGQGACYLLPFAVQTADLGPLAAALVLVPYVVGSVAAAPFSGVLAERFGAGRLIVIALLVGVAGCLGATAAGTSLSVLAVCNALIGASVNTTLPVAAVLVVTMRTGQRDVGAGTAIAGLRIGQSLGPFLGPTVAGVVLTRSGVDAAWLALGLGLALGVGLHALARIRTTS
jgi:MFS family permease